MPRPGKRNLEIWDEIMNIKTKKHLSTFSIEAHAPRQWTDELE